MNRVVFSFLISSIAGLSTLIGSLIIFIKSNNKDKIILASLAFAASVMLSISLIDLIPESFNIFIKKLYLFPTLLIILIGLNIGIIISLFIKKYIPENNDKLYKIGIISMLAIIIHNIPEGMATFMATSNNIKLGIKLSIAISLHNIPEGISIAIPIYYSTKSKIKAVFYTFVAGLSELLGAIITYLFLKNLINEYTLGILFSIIAGIMIHISLFELLKTSYKYNNKKYTNLFFLIGIIIVIISKIVG